MSRLRQGFGAATSSRRVLVLALLTQGALILAAYGLSRLTNVSPVWGDPPRDMAVGLGGALVLAAANYVLLTRAPSNWLVDGVRAVYHEVLVPLFSRFSTPSIVLVGMVAGIGEEWLFRGVLQPIVGWVVASVAFGLAHVGARHMLPFGVWASGMGFLLGGLAVVTGGLTAPMVAHGVYDMLALAYLRRGAQNA
jgi:membrane protease YdiL (CAAX protease family)